MSPGPPAFALPAVHLERGDGCAIRSSLAPLADPRDQCESLAR
jgi:hypothetical protein